MDLAVSRSISVSEINIPPKALTGSAAKAASKASFTVLLMAQPHALLCFNIANEVEPAVETSVIRATAASTS